MTLKETIKFLQGVIKETDLAINDTILFEQAVKIAISKQIGEQKKENIANISQNRQTSVQNGYKPESKGKNDPITPKQKNFLQKLGYNGGFDMSKKDAMMLIKEMNERRRY